MEKLPKFTILALLVAVTAVGVFVFSSRVQKPKGAPQAQAVKSYTPRTARADAPQETVAVAPDGKKTLTMREEKGKESATFVFLIADKSTGAQKEIYRETAAAGSITIPFNTFSPDNKHIFLKKTVNGENIYFVLRTLESQTTVIPEISSLFKAKYPDYKITDVTGWGGLTLIVVNTDGRSFWFDVASNSFIQLSSRVN